MESVLVSRELLWFVVLLGVAERVRTYAVNRSLWLDESFLALNIIGRSMHRLLTAPLDFNQTAPAGFLFVEKAAVEVFDKGEYTFRALPFICGIIGLLLFPPLARRALGPVGAIIAVALFALSGPLVYYSSELKPYAGDIAATLAISVMALAALDDRLSVRRAFVFGLIGFVLIQLTYAGVMAAAGTGAVLVAIFTLDGRWDRSRPLVALVGTWAAGAVVFLFSRPGLEAGQFTRGQGRLGRFAPFPTSRTDITWYSDRVKDVVGDANFNLTRWPIYLVALLSIVGTVNLAARNWRVFALLAAPVIATVVASAAHEFPLLARTTLFFVPLLLLLVTNGIVVLARRLPRAIGAIAAACVVAALLAQVSSGGVYDIVQPFLRSRIKDDLTYIAKRWHPGDVLYVHYSSQYAFGYYSECACFRLPGGRSPGSLWPIRPLAVRDPSAQFPRAFRPASSSVIIGTRRPISEPGPLPFYRRDALAISRHRRAWILVTLSQGRELGLIRNELLAPLDRRGRRVSELARGGANGGEHVWLYAFPGR
jgi:hypothetical protein